MKKQSNLIALTLLSISLLLTIQQFFMGMNDKESSGTLFTLWMIAFVILISMWCKKDQEGRQEFTNIGLMALIFWPIVLPYYLVKTRGVEGLILFIGFSSLYISPNLSWLIGYQFS